MATPAAPEAPKAATIQELKAACPNADATFLMAQLEASATVEAAGKAWMVELTNRLAAKDAEVENLKKTPPATTPPVVAAGVAPLPTNSNPSTSEVTGDAIEMFDEAVSVHMKAGKSRHEATKIVCRKNPELRAAMVAAHNAEYKPARR